MDDKDPNKNKDENKGSKKLERFDERLLSELDDAVDKLNELGESIFGRDFYGEPNGSEQWNKLDPADRAKLRTAFAFGVLSTTSLKDMEKNPLLIGAALLPGPGGTFIALGLMLSYTFRWDSRAKEVRQKMREMLDKGVLLEHYEDVLVPKKYDATQLTVDTRALIKKKYNMIKGSTLEATDSFLSKMGKAYKDFKEAARPRVEKTVRTGLDPFIGERKAQKLADKLSDGYNAAEDLSSTGYKKAQGGLSWVWRKAASPLFKETYESAKTLKDLSNELSDKFYDGYQHNKKEFKELLTKFGL